ncbi:hypothetical protein L218DRAFT_1060011 [Marasmius fiardii PR-910]|nr:hypothetical protein L218DRAFT_1060011 [Marasmius fiardii PR-910]
MLFARFFALSFLLGLVSAASIAVPVEKRFGTPADAAAILKGLLGNLKATVPQFVAIQQAGNATEANVTPLVSKVVGDLQTAGVRLTALANPFYGLKRRQSAGDITAIINEIGSVIQTIVSVLQTLVTVQNIETLIGLVNQAFGLATTILKFVSAIIGLIPK